MRHAITRGRSFLVATAFAVTLAACGGGGAVQPSSTPEPSSQPSSEAPTDAPTDAPTVGVPTTDTGAASLRAALQHKIEEHVYLAGIAIVTNLQGGDFEAAAGVLDLNSVDLGDTIDSVYAGAKDPFLELWRKHIGFFVDYTTARVGGDDAAAQQAKDDLDAYRADFDAFLAGANPNLTQGTVADLLLPHVQTVFATIDAAIAGDGTAFDKLRIAAQGGEPIATALAGAIATQFPEQFDGTVEAPASALRSGLTNLLVEHTYLAGIAITQTLGETGGGEAATATLDTNSVALADAIDGVYDGAGDTFLELWRKHISFFVDYAVATAGGDDAAAQQAKDDLDTYRADFGAFLAGANPNLTQDAVADALVPHVETVFAAIDAAVAGDSAVYERLYDAAQEMPAIADVLAGAIVTQFPENFAENR